MPVWNAGRWRADPRGPEWAWKVRKYFESEEIFKKLKKAGVRMAVGTDAVTDNLVEYPGLFFKETDEFVELGYTPMETIVAATKVGAEVSDALGRLGTIEKGQLADLVVLEKDPLADIRDLRSATVVVQAGRIVRRQPASRSRGCRNGSSTSASSPGVAGSGGWSCRW